MPAAIGIDLGGSSVKTVVVNTSGRTLAKRTVEFQDDSRMDWAQKIRELAADLCSRFGSPSRPSQVIRIGLSAPGLAASDERSIAFMPGRLQGLEKLDWTSFLKSRTPVPVLNDAQAALLGESWLGAARKYRDVILLTLGTGVGGAAMVDGHLLRGRIGRAGHLGHICLDPKGPPDVVGTPGTLELAIGNCTIVERTGGRFQTTHELVAAYKFGDADAARIWLKSIRALACAIASFINVLDPEAVVIGGGIARAGQALFGPLIQSLAEVEWRPGGHKARIIPARLGAYAGAYGAAFKALGGRT